MAKSRRRFTAAFKAQLALSAISERETMAELSRRHKIHPTQIAKWKRELLENAASAFSGDRASTDASAREAELLRKIGELTVERDFLARGLERFHQK